MRNCQIQLFMHVKYYRKNVFVENVWPQNLALFVYVSTHCVETVKWLDYYRYSQLTRWCSGNASALDARGPGFNPRLRQGFLCLIFCIVVVFLLFCPKTHYLSEYIAIPFTMLINLFIQYTQRIARFVTNYKGKKIQTQHL